MGGKCRPVSDSGKPGHSRWHSIVGHPSDEGGEVELLSQSAQAALPSRMTSCFSGFPQKEVPSPPPLTAPPQPMCQGPGAPAQSRCWFRRTPWPGVILAVCPASPVPGPCISDVLTLFPSPTGTPAATPLHSPARCPGDCVAAPRARVQC